MKKTKDVTKYNLKWQIVRILNKKEKNIDVKISNVMNFYCSNKNYNNWERIYNYLEGLYKGYKQNYQYECLKINECLEWMKKNKTNDMNDSDVNFSDIEDNLLIELYKDLYKRNQKWLSKNYRNSELNLYLEKIYNYLKNKMIILDKNFDIYPNSKSTHKFFF